MASCTQQPSNSECPTQQHNGKPKEYPYQFTEKPDVVEWKPTYYVYVEKKGHFKETAKAAWDQFFTQADEIDALVTREKHVSQYRMDVEPWIYRAGFTVSSKPASLPDGYHVTELDGGSYLRFTLTGAYEHLGEACGRAFEIVGKQYHHQQRKDWNMEYYVNNPKQVKSEDLITEILIPIYQSNCEQHEASSTYQLTETPDVVEWKPCYFVYVEKKGNFKETARAAWGHFMSHIDKIDAQVTRVKHISQYRMDVEPWIYRAGYIVSAKPTSLPDDFHCIEYPGGSYLRFVLTGGYQHLEAACKRVWNVVGTKYQHQRRNDWNMEYYVNDMRKVKPEELMTEILIPIKSEAVEDEKTKSTYELSEKPEYFEWKPCYFVYCERQGHFLHTAKPCWEQFFANVDKIDAQVKREKHVCLYRFDVDPWIYRAGYTVNAKPTSLPDGYHVMEFPGGQYLRWIMKGSDVHLPSACGRVFSQVDTEFASQKRSDFNIEYKNEHSDGSYHMEICIPVKSFCEGGVAGSTEYQLTETPENVEWKPYYYVYVEKKGSFKDTAGACWNEMKVKLAEIKAQTTVDKYIAQYRTDTEPWVYRAGVTVSAPPASLPSGYECSQFSGGSFLSFTLTGGYNHLPEACGRVFGIVSKKYAKDVKHDWNIEYYVNDPAHAKPQDLITQILVPINKSDSQ